MEKTPLRFQGGEASLKIQGRHNGRPVGRSVQPVAPEVAPRLAVTRPAVTSEKRRLEIELLPTFKVSVTVKD
ncbi:Hypothetical protein NTJ_00697 [Nesidiocoris tenuis]|uniref:Uncharacterized protein n=1 Tax=Nesidiocoris tenuis TaxID=355587 RepID=A0ABN7A6M9_9HEMI|nr:Hypothetical protein NTJ_00697 [Nesidiocoris tenuis]